MNRLACLLAVILFATEADAAIITFSGPTGANGDPSSKYQEAVRKAVRA